jgi:thioredoxin 1
MKYLILSFSSVLLLLLTFCGAVSADSRLIPYSAAALEKAQMQDAVSVIQFHASWCPTCVKQESALKQVSTDARFASISFFQADYDDSDVLQEQLSVSRQSTLVLMKGKKELARVNRVTEESAIADFISKAQP